MPSSATVTRPDGDTVSTTPRERKTDYKSNPNGPETSGYRSYPAKQLAQYLRMEAERAGGDIYVNGDRLASDLDLPPGDIDRLLRELSGSTPGLSFSIATTTPRTVWRLSRPD